MGDGLLFHSYRHPDVEKCKRLTLGLNQPAESIEQRLNRKISMTVKYRWSQGQQVGIFLFSHVYTLISIQYNRTFTFSSRFSTRATERQRLNSELSAL